MTSSDRVRVALRVRPALARELLEACQSCVTRTPNEPQVWIGSNKAFTYDYVFDEVSTQIDVYANTVEELVMGCMEGYNCTVLAYGQTGSGKTYTMGTGFDLTADNDSLGLLPRAVNHIFEEIDRRCAQARDDGQKEPSFKVVAQFLELYNEDVVDLLVEGKIVANKKGGIRITEDANGNICIMGATTRVVRSSSETLSLLKTGAFNRTTGSTAMNDASSRSHAIFTLELEQQRLAKDEDELTTLTAKFNFVDLAGSERLKRTGATGTRQKEGIAINSGLLALGNVISALGDESRKASHVPYRDSKLTRMLQDSLGGNSRTLMIACVSPCDTDFMETLNTLKYANRARNIQNKVSANQDKTSRTILALRQELQRLQLEVMEFRQGKRVMNELGEVDTNDMYHENTMLNTENHNLRTRIKAMQETIDVLTAKNAQLIAKAQLSKSRVENSANDEVNGDVNDDAMTALVEGYVREIEELRAKLCESEKLCEQLRSSSNNKRQQRVSMNSSIIQPVDVSSEVQELISMAKKSVKEMSESQYKARKRISETEDDKKEDENENEDDGDDEESDNDEDQSDNNEEEEEDEDDDDDDDDRGSVLNEELAELTSEISLKQRLIEELETSQLRLKAMKQQYESKLMALQTKISVTEQERDKVLKTVGQEGGLKSKSTLENVSKIKKEYEERLEKLKLEVKTLQNAKKEHAKLLKSQSKYEQQVHKLKSEVSTMKSAKVKLMQRMKEESKRHREMESKRNKELSQIKKTSRLNEAKIRLLEADKRNKENVLKRKTQELNMLRQSQRKKVFGNSNNRSALKVSNVVVEKRARAKWQMLEKEITKIALSRQAISQMENDMDRWLKEREKLSKRLDKMLVKRKKLLNSQGDNNNSTLVDDVDDQIESLRANVSYLHENIVECQQTIVQMEEANDEDRDDNEDNNEELMLNKLVKLDEMELNEIRYLVQKLTSMTIHHCCQATQKEAKAKELETKLAQISQQSTLHQQLLQHMIEQQDLEIFDLMIDDEDENVDDNKEVGDNDDSDDSTSTKIIHAAKPNAIFTIDDDTGVGSDSSASRAQKARRKMTTKQDLLFNENEDSNKPTNNSVLVNNALMSSSSSSRLLQSPMSSSSLSQRSQSFVKRDDANSSRLFNRSRSFVKNNNNGGSYNNNVRASGRFSRARGDMSTSTMTTSQALDRRRLSSTKQSSSSSSKLYNCDNSSSSSPPSSPPSGRRDVFQRLLSTTGSMRRSDPSASKGFISLFRGKKSKNGRSILSCVALAEGHEKAVLSIYAFKASHKLLSGSKDRTAKLWDLERQKEILSLTEHPNNVSVVRCSEPLSLAFTVSSAFIKVWDIRSATCVKTLSSSGLTTQGAMQFSTNQRILSLPTGESIVNDVALAPNGLSLYSAAADKVRVWDLRNFHAIGKLNAGHSAAIMCLTTSNDSAVNGDESSSEIVVTGSKDHTIKVFSLDNNSRSGCVQPWLNLFPPHYDGVERLALRDRLLFSASRDTCIKKWTLGENEANLERSINNAHKDWICGLDFLPLNNAANDRRDANGGLLVSGCRAGQLKVWRVRSCSLLSEIQAHNAPINAVTTNNTHVFSASNDTSVAIWKVNGEAQALTDSDSGS